MKYIYYNINDINDIKFIKTKNMTYLISDNQGLIHDRLRELLNNIGFIEKNKYEVLNTNKYVDFFWMGQSNELGDRFDKDLYQIKSKLKTLLYRDKSHLTFKDIITNKQQLFLNMQRYFPDIYKKHMAKTWLIQDIKEIKPNQVLIVKPAGHGACAGVGVTVVTNNKELEEAKEINKKYRNIIVSEYIKNPLLWNKRKFHLRMYILINSDLTWSFWEKGKAMTAELEYKKSDWTNKKIHDSHGKTTPKDIYFPDDILQKNKIKDIINQMKYILNAVAKIIEPNIKCYQESEKCCEIFGIDFMITDDYIVKLIEINAEAGYGYKDDNKKYKEYCKEYFDWFYANSIVQLLF